MLYFFMHVLTYCGGKNPSGHVSYQQKKNLIKMSLLDILVKRVSRTSAIILSIQTTPFKLAFICFRFRVQCPYSTTYGQYQVLTLHFFLFNDLLHFNLSHYRRSYATSFSLRLCLNFSV